MLEWIPLYYYALAGLLNFVTSFALSIFVFSKNPRARTNQTFSLFAFSVAGWSLCYFLWLNTDKSYLAEFYLRTLMVFVIFIPSTFTHFILTLTKAKFSNKINLYNYLISGFLGIMAYTKYLASDIGPFLVFPYWLKPRIFFAVHSVHFFANVLFAHFLMIRVIKHQSGIFKNQVLYVFLGTAIGYAAGALNYLTWYKVPVPPFLNPLVSVYVALVSYAIFKYRLMDINFVIRRSIVNLLITIIISGILFSLSLIPGLIMRFLIISTATLIMAMYLPKIKFHTENTVTQILYKEKYKYQDRLDDFIEEMPFIPRIEDLFDQTVTALTETLGIKEAAVFTLDQGSGSYSIKEQVGLDNTDLTVSASSELIGWMKANEEILVTEEIEKSLDKKRMDSINELLDKLNSSICIPAMLETELIGFIALGEKQSGEMYSHIDLRILQRLGTMLALSLNNKRIVEELHHERQIAELNKNKLNVITSMASGFADRLGNNLQAAVTFFDNFSAAMKGIAGEQKSEAREGLESFANVTNSSIKKLVDLTDLMRSFYTAKYVFQKYGPEEFIDIVKELKEVLNPDIGNKQIKIDCNLVGNPPATVFDRNAIKEALRHLMQNSIHAIPETRKGNIAVKVTGPVKKNGMDYLGIFVEDNGQGIADSFREKLFIPFETTKGTVGGLGLGLVSCQFFVAQHEGKIRLVKSEADINLPDEKRGTVFQIDLPVKDKPPETVPDYRDLLKEFHKR